jgi:hypothetical protein
MPSLMLGHPRISTNRWNAAVVAGIGDAGWKQQYPESGITDPGYSAANESADVFCDEARISLVMTGDQDEKVDRMCAELF